MNMLNLHIWAVLLDIVGSILIQPFICTPAYAGIPLGLLKSLDVNIMVIVYIGFTTFLMVCFSIIAIFENRFFILFAQYTWWKNGRRILLGFNYLLVFVYIIPTLMQNPDQKYAREVLFKQLPQLLQYDTPENPIFVLVIEEYWFLLSQRANTVFISIQVMTFVILLRINMKKAFRTMHLSERTLHLQQEFLRALNLQVFIPFVIIFIPAILLGILGANQISNQGANNLVFLITSTHGAVSTLIMIYLQKPYREACRRFLNRFTEFNASVVSIT